jgi:hypothetical protein
LGTYDPVYQFFSYNRQKNIVTMSGKVYKLQPVLMNRLNTIGVQELSAMNVLRILVVTALTALPFVSSCSSLGPGTAVKAGFSNTAGPSDRRAAMPDPDEGWAERYIPGWKKLNDSLPPPTEARTKWDQWRDRKPGHSEGGPLDY